MVNLNAEKEAKIVFEVTWADRGVPVDPVTIGRSLGLKVLEAELPDEVSGAIVKDVGADPIIMVEQRDSMNRKRFTCAHELGHFIWHSREPDTAGEYAYVDLRDPQSATGHEQEEVFANGFGAALLMPADDTRKAWRKLGSIATLSYKFGVSSEAMGFRLKNLRIT